MSRTQATLIRALALFGVLASNCAAGSPEGLIADYRAAGAGPFDAKAGARAWRTEHRPPGAESPRACTDCHGSDLKQAGRHVTTGKVIGPMAISADPKRLSDPVKTERWFRRNCRWTWGRECTPQEKGDFIRLIQGL